MFPIITLSADIRWTIKNCYKLRLSLHETSTVIGWFLVTCLWSNSNVVARAPNTTARDLCMTKLRWHVLRHVLRSALLWIKKLCRLCLFVFAIWLKNYTYKSFFWALLVLFIPLTNYLRFGLLINFQLNVHNTPDLQRFSPR